MNEAQPVLSCRPFVWVKSKVISQDFPQQSSGGHRRRMNIHPPAAVAMLTAHLRKITKPDINARDRVCLKPSDLRALNSSSILTRIASTNVFMADNHNAPCHSCPGICPSLHLEDNKVWIPSDFSKVREQVRNWLSWFQPRIYHLAFSVQQKITLNPTQAPLNVSFTHTNKIGHSLEASFILKPCSQLPVSLKILSITFSILKDNGERAQK